MQEIYEEVTAVVNKLTEAKHAENALIQGEILKKLLERGVVAVREAAAIGERHALLYVWDIDQTQLRSMMGKSLESAFEPFQIKVIKASNNKILYILLEF